MKKRIFDVTIPDAINEAMANAQNTGNRKLYKQLETAAQIAETAYVAFEDRLHRILMAVFSGKEKRMEQKIVEAEACLNCLKVNGRNVVEDFVNKHLEVGAQVVLYRQMAYVSAAAALHDVATYACAKLEERIPELAEKEGDTMKFVATLQSAKNSKDFLDAWNGMSAQ